MQRKDKTIFAIMPENSIGEFESYDKVKMSYSDIQQLVKDTISNSTWVNALSNVNGVYLIRDKKDGKQYVGSAYGKEGIFSRWKVYATNGHGGNKKLLTRDPNTVEFSVREICPSTMSANDIVSRENRWKQVLGTREFGLNDN